MVIPGSFRQEMVLWEVEMACRRGGPVRIGPDQVKRADNDAQLASRAVARQLGERMAEWSGPLTFLLIDKKNRTARPPCGGPIALGIRSSARGPRLTENDIRRLRQCGSPNDQLACQEIERHVPVDRLAPQPPGQLVEHQAGGDVGRVDRAPRGAAAGLGLGLGK